MPFNMFGQLIGSLLSTQASYTNTKQINETNKEIADKTNKANRELVEMQNKAAAEESQKAYDRSKASNQVNLLQQAGMSRAGAINALNGGGSYTPAPVNTSQDSAPQMQTADLSALGNISQIFAQRAQQKHDEKMQEKQLKEQKRQFDEQLQFERDKWNEEKPTRDEQYNALKFQNDLNKALSQYKDEDGKVRNLLVEGAAAERVANIEEARLNSLKFSLINDALQLPGNLLKKFLIELNDSMDDAQGWIEDVRKGKKTAKDIYDYSHYDNFPDEVEDQGKKFKRYKLADGVYEWREVK